MRRGAAENSLALPVSERLNSLEAEIQPADPASRRQLLLALAGIVVLALAGWAALDRWLEHARLTLDPPAARAAVAGLLMWSTVAVCAIVCAFAAYAWRLGWTVAVHGRFPPAGARVVRDTPVLRGAAARRRGRLVQAVAACLAVLSMALLAVMHQLVSRLG